MTISRHVLDAQKYRLLSRQGPHVGLQIPIMPFIANVGAASMQAGQKTTATVRFMGPGSDVKAGSTLQGALISESNDTDGRMIAGQRLANNNTSRRLLDHWRQVGIYGPTCLIFTVLSLDGPVGASSL